MTSSLQSVTSSPFFTGEQNRVFAQLSSHMRDMVSIRLLSQGREGIHQARILLQAFEQNDRERHETISSFFLQMFATRHENILFEKFSRLQIAGQGQAFFAHAATRSLADIETTLNSFQETPRSLLCLTYAPLSKRAPQHEKWRGLCQQMSLSRSEKKNILLCLEAFTSSRDPSNTYSDADLQEFLDQMLGIHQEYGEELYDKLCTTIAKQDISLDLSLKVARRLRLLNSGSAPLVYIRDFIHGKLSWQNFVTSLGEGISMQEPWDEEREPFEHLIQRFANQPFALQPSSLATIAEQFLQIQELRLSYAQAGKEELVGAARALRTQAIFSEKTRLRFLAIGMCAIRRYFHVDLHPTQILAVLGQLLFPEGCIAQVKTGEGKSMIVALMSFLLLMEGKRVHVVSSSNSLAIRDQRKFASFFTEFDICSSHICDKNPEAKCFQAHLLYGAASDFEFAIMREMLHLSPLFSVPIPSAPGEKRFDCVIVDEVDNLTIDTLRNGARLAFPAEVSYDWIYPLILRFIQQSPAGTLSQLKAFLSSAQGKQSPALSDQQLELWLQSAYHAQYELIEDHHYIIQHCSDGKKISIIDAENTGHIMESCRWSNGIHEFVEAKHSIPVEKESLSPLSISHPVLYQMYRSIFGLTGTLGSQCEREEIRDIYNVSSFDVPTHRPSQRIDHAPVIVSSKSEILARTLLATEQCIKAERPILILCETIQFSQKIHDLLTSRGIPHEMLNEKQEKTEEIVLRTAGTPGAVTVATNTAGRGTDIQVDPLCLERGGLHVFLTFFPTSLRVEEQARGRAGRQGQKGSSELVFTSPLSADHLEEHRALGTQLTRQLHSHFAQIERFRFTLVQQFFSCIASFKRERENMMYSLARTWQPRRLANTSRPHWDQLLSKDTQIAQEAFRLLTALPDQEIAWRGLVDAASQRVLTLAIQDFAIRFQQKVETLVRDSRIEHRVKEVFTLDTLFPGIAQTFSHMITGIYQELLDQMQALFTQEFPLWQTLLSENGVDSYIRSVIKGLPPISPRSEF